MKRVMLFLPLLIFIVLAILLYGALGKDPQYLPSAMIDRPFPDFTLATLENMGETVSQETMLGEVKLLNVWASWCYACRIEHPFLSKIAEEYGIPLYGLNYKNDAADAKRWLAQFGNPYAFSLHDRDGRLGIDLGVAGAPETFVIDKEGLIRYRHIGIIDEKVWLTKLQPLIQQLRAN